MKINTLYKPNEKITFENYLNKCGVNDIQEFINPSGKYLDNYYSYNNIKDGVQMFKYHYLQNDNAYILCDSGDTDGILSAVIMYQYMKALNKDWDIEILIHSGKQRGLQDEELYEYVMRNPKGLLIIPDSGTNDIYLVNDIYTETDMDVLVLDHHNLDDPIQKGVLINNQDPLSKVSKNGSGCLVTHKFLQALDVEFNKDWSNWFVDMVALSLVSDAMDMSDQQNRTYYHYGLEIINCINNEFLLALINKFIGDKPYTQRDISFKVIPKINSICRSKDKELKQKLICAFLGYEDIDEVLNLCAEAHKNQIKTVDDVISANIGKIESFADNQLNILSCDDMPRSYSGLVAGKIMNMCDNKPTIVGKIIDGELIGSLRSPIPLQKDLDNNEFVEWARGHDESCGVCIKEENIQPLIDYYNTLNLSYTPHIDVLQSYAIKDIPNYLFNEFSGNTEVLWGKGIEMPQFHITLNYIPSDIKIMGKTQTTLKINKFGIDVVMFYINAENKEKLGLILEESISVEPNSGEVIINKMWSPKDNNVRSLEIIGTFNINKYVGKYKIYTTNQIIVNDFEVKEKKIITPQTIFK